MDLINVKWNEKTYEEFTQYLISIGSEKLSAFATKLIPTKYKIIGVNSKTIDGIIKNIAAGDFESFIKISRADYYEQLGIRGAVIATAKCSEQRRKELILDYLPYIDNWGLNDSLCSNLKLVAKNQEFYHDLIVLQLKGDSFSIRFALGILMYYYLPSDKYIDEVLKLVNEVKDDNYYVQMMQAWLISEGFLKQRSKTLAFLKNNNLPKWVQNKGIQKIRESRRVSDEDKELVKSLKK